MASCISALSYCFHCTKGQSCLVSNDNFSSVLRHSCFLMIISIDNFVSKDNFPINNLSNNMLLWACISVIPREARLCLLVTYYALMSVTVHTFSSSSCAAHVSWVSLLFRMLHWNGSGNWVAHGFSVLKQRPCEFLSFPGSHSCFVWSC